MAIAARTHPAKASHSGKELVSQESEGNAHHIRAQSNRCYSPSFLSLPCCCPHRSFRVAFALDFCCTNVLIKQLSSKNGIRVRVLSGEFKFWVPDQRPGESFLVHETIIILHLPMPFLDDEESLRLTLSPPGHRSRVQRSQSQELVAAAPRRTRQASSADSSSSQASVCSTMPKDERIPPPYPWATDRRAHVHSLDFLMSCAITRIRGEVICKRCDGTQMVDLDLRSTFMQVNSYFIVNRDTMHDRAPKYWTSPRLLDCSLCRQTDCVKPVMHAKKRNINWLFLLLTQTLGLCTLDQLKYFCKHTRRHRTGAKDRVLYLSYVGLLKQLNPAGPYE